MVMGCKQIKKMIMNEGQISNQCQRGANFQFETHFCRNGNWKCFIFYQRKWIFDEKRVREWGRRKVQKAREGEGDHSNTDVTV